MEKHGIGTDASMATHINNICERTYVEIGGGRSLIPTELGVSLVRGYKKIDPELVAPTTRSNIEKSLDMIARGQADYDQVLNAIIKTFTAKFEYFRGHISLMDEFFGTSFGTYEEAVLTAKGFSKCGKCSRLMKLLEKFHKLECDHCKTTFDLPNVLILFSKLIIEWNL
jgi:DNA topoisomerase-3